MQVKTLELRDRATFIAILAICLGAENSEQNFLLRRCGYGPNRNIIMTRLDGQGKATNDPYAWGDRTMAQAHHHIYEKWDSLEDGDVVDVEFILGETTKPKLSEKYA